MKYRVITNRAEMTSETGVGNIRFFISNNDYRLAPLLLAQGAGKTDNNYTVAKLENVFKLGQADTIRVGFEYRRNEFLSYPAEDATMKSQTAAVSGMWLHAFNQDFTWLNAARLDRYMFNRTGAVLVGSPFSNAAHDRSFLGTTYNSAMVYRLSQLDSVKIMAARGLQLPSLMELGGNSNKLGTVLVPVRGTPIPFTALSIGNPFLSPSSTMHYEASYERQFLELAASGRIAAYHQDVKKLRDISPSARPGCGRLSRGLRSMTG